MDSVKGMTLKAQGFQERVMSGVKAAMLVFTTGAGTGVAVREFVFSHWGWLAPVVDAVGIYVVAGVITLVVLAVSAWLCLVAGCFVGVLEALRPTKPRTPAGKARARVRAAQVRGVRRRTRQGR